MIGIRKIKSLFSKISPAKQEAIEQCLYYMQIEFDALAAMQQFLILMDACMREEMDTSVLSKTTHNDILRIARSLDPAFIQALMTMDQAGLELRILGKHMKKVRAGDVACAAQYLKAKAKRAEEVCNLMGKSHIKRPTERAAYKWEAAQEIRGLLKALST